MGIRSSLPTPVRNMIRSTYVGFGRVTAGQRRRPDMIIIGGQRCGTTSLFRALEQHPQIVRPTLNKGINYFDINYHRGPRWYAGHFPFAERNGRLSRRVTFEASGYYLFHPLAPERIARDLPDVKIVALLREPVERAYSAWKHEKARGYETEPFQRALELEEERTRGEVARMTEDPGYQSHSYRHNAYAARGDYAMLLRRYYDRFPASQIHVMYSEDFFADPAAEFASLADFLGVAPHGQIAFDQHNARPSGSMPADARRMLTERFTNEADELESLVGRRPPWAGSLATGPERPR